MEKITVELDAKWIGRINSPFFYIIPALTGVSITFAPVFLSSWAGRMSPPGIPWFYFVSRLSISLLCFTCDLQAQ